MGSEFVRVFRAVLKPEGNARFEGFPAKGHLKEYQTIFCGVLIVSHMFAYVMASLPSRGRNELTLKLLHMGIQFLVRLWGFSGPSEGKQNEEW